MSYKLSLDGKVKFYEKSHKYKIGRKELTSGTTFLKPYFSKFDAKAIARNISNGFKARNYAKFKEGIEVSSLDKKKATMKYWLSEWDEAATHGTFVHNVMEQYILDYDNKENTLHEIDDMSVRDALKAISGMEWFDEEIETISEPELYTEYIVYNEDIGVAGQIDLKVVDSDGVVHLYDWKTNKEIKKYGKPANEPISDLKDCNYIKYVLQLSLYAYMEELKGAEIGKLVIVHLTETGAVPYEVPYLKETIQLLIDYENIKND